MGIGLSALMVTADFYQGAVATGTKGKRLASILFALLIEERFNIPGFEEVLACVVMTVLLSMVLHGASAAPIASRFKSTS